MVVSAMDCDGCGEFRILGMAVIGVLSRGAWRGSLTKAHNYCPAGMSSKRAIQSRAASLSTLELKPEG